VNLPQGFVLESQPQQQAQAPALPAGFVLEDGAVPASQIWGSAPAPRTVSNDKNTPLAPEIDRLLAVEAQSPNAENARTARVEQHIRRAERVENLMDHSLVPTPDALLTKVLPRQTVEQGVMFGLSDELTAGIQALFGKGKYDELLEAERLRLERTRKDRPIASGVGEVTGALLTTPFVPAANVFRGANVLQRAGNAAITGAGLGAAYGFGTGEGGAENRLNSAVNGAVVGGLTGGIGAPLVEGVVAGTRALARPFRGITNPEAEASRRVVQAIERDNPNVPNAVQTAANTMEGANASGVPMVAGDMGRGRVQALARSASDTSPDARTALQNATSDRFETQADRISNVVRSIVGGDPNAPVMRDAISVAARNANRPAYRQAYQDGERVALWNSDLEQLVQAPEVQNAIRVALPQLRNWAVNDGLRPPVGAFEINGTRTTLRQTANGNTIMPSLQLWDYVKRALDKNGSPTAQQFSQALRTQLDELVPSYATARAGAARGFGAQDALEAGQQFVMSSMPIKEARIAFAQFSPAERQLFAQGFASDLLDKIAKVGDRRSVINSIFQNPDARARLQLALGPQGAQRIEAAARLESVMDMLRTATQGNSKTAQFLMDLGVAGGTGSIGVLGGLDPTTASASAIAAVLARRGRGMIDMRVATRVGELLASNDPQRLRQAYEMVSRNSRLMEAVRRAENDLGRITAPNAPQVLPQNILPAAAEQDQNNRPR
jgi:hypothetical protein